MEVPEVRFAMTSDDVRIAYEDFGEGPTAVICPTFISAVESNWGHPLLSRFMERMAEYVRVLLFDHRGAGMSDGFIETPSLSDRVRDIEAVMNAAGAETASIAGFDVGGAVAVGFAVEHPERVERLVLLNASIGKSGSERAAELNPDRYGMEERPKESYRPPDDFGADASAHVMWFSPSAAKHPDYIEWVPKAQRVVASRDQYKRLVDSASVLDVTDLLPRVTAPTQIIHTVGNRLYHIGYARLAAELIPGATLKEMEGIDQNIWVADNWMEITDASMAWIIGRETEVPVERKYSVVMFSDLVDSTSAALKAGDAQWHQKLDIHDRISRRVISNHGGVTVKNTGDGHLATFDQPDNALDAVISLREALEDIDLRLRAGLHFGQVEMRGADIAGAVVNLAARVEQAAADGEIYTTTAIREMLIGSPYEFESVGTFPLKGFPGEWTLHKVNPHPRP